MEVYQKNVENLGNSSQFKVLFIVCSISEIAAAKAARNAPEMASYYAPDYAHFKF